MDLIIKAMKKCSVAEMEEEVYDRKALTEENTETNLKALCAYVAVTYGTSHDENNNLYNRWKR